MRRKSRRRSVPCRAPGRSLAAVLAVLALASAVSARADEPVPRRAEALERLRAKYGPMDAGFRLAPGSPDASARMAGAAARSLPAAKVEDFGAAAAESADTPGGEAALAAATDAWTTLPLADRRLLAGHMLRRTTFGPTPAEADFVTRFGYARWVNYQLGPINDAVCLARLPRQTANRYDDWVRLKRWYARMVCTRAQLRERTTLAWHELFATSNE